METSIKKVKITPQMYASKGKRFANFIIDYIGQLIIGGAIGIAMAIISEITGDYEYVAWIDTMGTLGEYALGIVILIVYYMVFETITGRTLGKYITNTKVLTEDGQKPEADKILYRTLSRMIPFEAFSFLGDEGRGWHDSIAKTVVVDVKKYNEIVELQNSLSEIGNA
ncbi:RDD family protein [Flavobacterium tibetense]|jgi:uncharacterized RDD family membrane protein YckC|uniref:RDD family protein n=1 Tax=Flavobacterium tibetense TaxID=2233533 RepID=A0A365NZ04_9FLAO|nr:RDD family protein [Flavobacterium tibetense]RBA27496.1 RDD family protein [Flavobacterium tibetense]